MGAAATGNPATGEPDILMVYPWCLDHVGHGNIQRALALGRYLARRGRTVDLVYQGNPRVEPAHGQYRGFRRVHRVEGGAWLHDDSHARRLADFYGALPLPAPNLQPSAALTRLVRALLDAEPYRVVLATYAWTAPIFQGLPRQVLRVLDMQDVIHEHARDCEATTSATTPFTLPRETEEFLWRQWDLVLTITPDDLERVRHDLLPHQHVVCVPHACPATARTAAVGNDDTAIYTGSDNLSNQAAVRWLLEQAWPRVRQARPLARLAIAGLICRSLPASLSEVPGVDLLGFRDDLRADVAAAGTVVAPYLYGSGLKIKVVEAALAGKAIVTTPAGAIGSGLASGHSAEIWSDPQAFADALARLLSDASRRRTLGDRALRHARRVFSEASCYEPMLRALQALAVPATPRVVLAAGALASRVRQVVDAVAPSRVVVWGNGAHARALLAGLSETGVQVALVLDGLAPREGLTPEGRPVVDPDTFNPQRSDLVVLSSETYEDTLWASSLRWQPGGAMVMGFYGRGRLSPALLAALGPLGRRLDPSVRRPDLPRPDRSIIVWDTGGDALRWDRLAWMEDLAQATAATGWTPRLLVPSALAAQVGESGDHWRPVLQWARQEAAAAEGVFVSDAQISRVTGLIATTTAPLLADLCLGPADVVIVCWPTLPECLGLASALRQTRRNDLPRVIVHGWESGGGTVGDKRLVDRWRRLCEFALADLRDAARGRLAVVAPDADSANALAHLTGAVPEVVGYPARRAGRVARIARPEVFCFGDVGHPDTVVRLRTLAACTERSRRDAPPLTWRSTHVASQPERESWAAGLSAELGVRRLGAGQTGRVRAELCGSSVVVLLEGSRPLDWHRSILAHAAISGIPVLAPEDATTVALAEECGASLVCYSASDEMDLCRHLEHALTGRPGRGAATARGRAAPAQVLRRMLRAAEEHRGRGRTRGTPRREGQ